jgi:transcription elongation factor Elf1
MTTNTKGSPAYFACPDCNKLSKVTETRQRNGWKYRRYTCPKGHSFSTREQAYTPVPGGADFIWRNVHASDTSQKPVTKTAKIKHEFECPRCGHCCRQWVGLTKEEVDSWKLPDCPTVFEFVQFIEAKIKEKNT